MTGNWVRCDDTGALKSFDLTSSEPAYTATCIFTDNLSALNPWNSTAVVRRLGVYRHNLIAGGAAM